MASEQVREALRRFVDIDAAHERDPQNDDLWRQWQAAGVDYWLLTHPDDRRFRSMDPYRLPTVEEISQISEQLSHAKDGLPRNWRLLASDRTRAERSAQLAWFHELMRSLCMPIYGAIGEAKNGDTSNLEILIRFLEADPYCFRSGYCKADVIKTLTRLELGDPHRARLRGALLAALERPATREFRSYIRLARYLDQPSLRNELNSRAASKMRAVARNASWMLEGLASS